MPESVCDADLRAACTDLAETMKADMVAIGAPVEVVMEAAAAFLQFAKHSQATRVRYGFTEQGGYSDPGSERAAMSSLNTTLSTYRDAMERRRKLTANPQQLMNAVADRDEKFIRCITVLQQKALQQDEPVQGTSLQFWLQSSLFPLMQEEGLVE